MIFGSLCIAAGPVPVGPTMVPTVPLPTRWYERPMPAPVNAGDLKWAVPPPQQSPFATVPSFGSPQTNPFGIGDVGLNSAPVFVDIDGDGDFDVFSGESLGKIFLFENTGSSTAPAFGGGVANPFGLTTVSYNSIPAFADLDNDGDFDALVGDFYGDTTFFENTGSVTSPAFTLGVLNANGLANVGNNAGPTLGDLDGDGDLDVLIGAQGGVHSYFPNTGSASSPAFGSAQTDPFGLTTTQFVNVPFLVDIDGDGDLDAFAGDAYGSINYFENTGTASAPAFAPVLQNPPDTIFGLQRVTNNSAFAFADLDGDGDLDALLGQQDGNHIYFENAEIVLPVELTGFTVQVDGRSGVLSWETASETNNAGFEVEHRTENADAWEKTAFVEGHGTSDVPQSYSYRAEELGPGRHRFRLNQRDLDGSSQYSNEVEVSIDIAGLIEISDVFPNPFTQRATFRMAVSRPQNVRAALFDVAGREVQVIFDGMMEKGASKPFTVDGSGLSSGVYVLAIEGASFSEHKTLLLVH